MHEAVAKWSSADPLRADVLLKILLDNAATGVFSRVQARLDEEQSRSVKQTAGPAPQGGEAPSVDDRPVPGRHVKIVREASLDELGLNALDYAKALATILRVSEGEFNFALFGKWGSEAASIGLQSVDRWQD